MIGTADTKKSQLENGFWSSGTGPEKLLLIGSCRTVAYLNYLARYNAGTNKFTLYFVDPFNWNWDTQDNFVDLEQAIRNCENDHRIIEMLGSVTILVREHYAHYGMWNSNREKGKSIYDFGMKPRLDICIPNFHDHFVLFQDQINFNAGGCVDLIRAFHEVPTSAMRANGLHALEKFYGVCRLSSFPEFEQAFRNTWTKRRYFWSYNHIAAPFSLFLFHQMNDRFLNLNLSDEFWREAEKEDQFSQPCSPVTQLDIRAYGLEWNGEISELVLPAL